MMDAQLIVTYHQLDQYNPCGSRTQITEGTPVLPSLEVDILESVNSLLSAGW